jgi:uncharacterized SAM-dependent methyltransferase
VDWTANVCVHESASPESTRRRLVAALKDHRIDPVLLYSGLRQASRWIALHKAVSPAQLDPDCVAIYDRAFTHIAQQATANVLHVVSLGCGDGAKDVNCLRLIRKAEKTVIYTPCDLSLEMVLTAYENATSALRGLQSNPFLCEVGACSTLPASLKSFDPAGTDRIVLFLGTIHNYDPQKILRSLLYVLRSQDRLLIGANLASAVRYEETLKTILLQYDNAPTRLWLFGALSELGLDEKDGDLLFELKPTPNQTQLKTIEVDFVFRQKKNIRLFDEEFSFDAGDKLKVFTSTRFTKASLLSVFESAGLRLEAEWIAQTEEEGLFLCRRK